MTYNQGDFYSMMRDLAQMINTLRSEFKSDMQNMYADIQKMPEVFAETYRNESKAQQQAFSKQYDDYQNQQMTQQQQQQEEIEKQNYAKRRDEVHEYLIDKAESDPEFAKLLSENADFWPQVRDSALGDSMYLQADPADYLSRVLRHKDALKDPSQLPQNPVEAASFIQMLRRIEADGQVQPTATAQQQAMQQNPAANGTVQQGQNPAQQQKQPMQVPPHVQDGGSVAGMRDPESQQYTDYMQANY